MCSESLGLFSRERFLRLSPVSLSAFAVSAVSSSSRDSSKERFRWSPDVLESIEVSLSCLRTGRSPVSLSEVGDRASPLLEAIAEGVEEIEVVRWTGQRNPRVESGTGHA